jgi:signal transduction histidine kinase
MKTLGEAALDLPWLSPSVASLTTLAGAPLPAVWPQLRNDPGMVLLAARALGSGISIAAPEHDLPLLELSLRLLPHYDAGFVDWNQPGPAAVQRTCYQQASLASRLAAKVGCAQEQAWMAGFLAPLGWLAVTAAGPRRIQQDLAALAQNSDAAALQQELWGQDHTALARRLARSWRLPAWLSSIVGHLGLHVRIAERLGAQPELFQLVQLSVLLLQKQGASLRLELGASMPELLAALHLDTGEADTCAAAAFAAESPAQTWAMSGIKELMPDFLRLALENRRRNDAAWIERLQRDLDGMQDALVRQCAEDQDRLQALKLSALAEFAAGAGHEINNPLAVISGQAQYVLKQLDWLDGPAEEIDNVGEYLDNLRLRIVPSLQKIIGQTQRIHSILTELMQFARPSSPKRQAVGAARLMREVAESLQADAADRNVALDCETPAEEIGLEVDPSQVRVALGCLVRNAIQAAPPAGKARIRLEMDGPGRLDLIVEDNGPGPAPSAQEHLFDPFFSGRSAGRGRGLGLPTAWRLARQQGGDVRFDGVVQGLTRFVLSLPATAAAPHNGVNGYHTESPGLNGVLPTLEPHK